MDQPPPLTIEEMADILLPDPPKPWLASWRSLVRTLNDTTSSEIDRTNAWAMFTAVSLELAGSEGEDALFGLLLKRALVWKRVDYRHEYRIALHEAIGAASAAGRTDLVRRLDRELDWVGIDAMEAEFACRQQQRMGVETDYSHPLNLYLVTIRQAPATQSPDLAQLYLGIAYCCVELIKAGQSVDRATAELAGALDQAIVHSSGLPESIEVYHLIDTVNQSSS